VFSSSKCSLFHNSNLLGSCFIHILYTVFAKMKKIIQAPKGQSYSWSGPRFAVPTTNFFYEEDFSDPMFPVSKLLLLTPTPSPANLQKFLVALCKHTRSNSTITPLLFTAVCVDVQTVAANLILHEKNFFHNLPRAVRKSWLCTKICLWIHFW